MELSRRSLLAGAGCLCGGCMLGRAAAARISPGAMEPMVARGYRPVDADEKGAWQQMERIEEEIASSNLLVRDPALNDYVRGVLGGMLGDHGGDIRLYIQRVPEFNAAMYPNGLTVIWSGLLTRMRSEAQLAAVVGHESGHYLRRHWVRGWRDLKRKTAIANFVSIGASIAGAAFNTNTGDLANGVSNAMLLSLFAYGRSLEAEADAYGLRLIERSGYTPIAASQTWAQLLAEKQASAKVRKKRVRSDASLFATHPSSVERMADLERSAKEITRPDRAYDDRRGAYRAALAPHLDMLLDDQVKLNDPGASLYLIDTLAKDGWTGSLRYFQGEVHRLRDEPGDAALAAEAYARAVAIECAPADAFRAHGYALLKAGKGEEGRRVLARYLELKPQAADAAMVRFSIAQ